LELLIRLHKQEDLVHKNLIIRVLDSFYTKGKEALIIVLKRCSRNFRELLQTNTNQLKLSYVKRLALQLLQALLCLHQYGWAHLDVSPENVMVTADPEASCGEKFQPDLADSYSAGRVICELLECRLEKGSSPAQVRGTC